MVKFVWSRAKRSITQTRLKLTDNPARDLPLASEFYFKVTFIFANNRLTIVYINLI